MITLFTVRFSLKRTERVGDKILKALVVNEIIRVAQAQNTCGIPKRVSLEINIEMVKNHWSKS